MEKEIEALKHLRLAKVVALANSTNIEVSTKYLLVAIQATKMVLDIYKPLNLHICDPFAELILKNIERKDLQHNDKVEIQRIQLNHLIEYLSKIISIQEILKEGGKNDDK